MFIKDDYVFNIENAMELKVIIADDEIFVACPVSRLISEDCERVDCKHPEIYSNDTEILKNTPIEKMVGKF